MTHQILTRIVVTSLILLGDGAFASEINPRTDDEPVASGNAVQILQPTFLSNSGSKWQPILAGVNTIQAEINLTYLTFAAVTDPVTDALKYDPSNPRAPPVPAK